MVTIKKVAELPKGGRRASLPYDEIMAAAMSDPGVWQEVAIEDRTQPQLASIAQHLRKLNPLLQVTTRGLLLFVMAPDTVPVPPVKAAKKAKGEPEAS